MARIWGRSEPAVGAVIRERRTPGSGLITYARYIGASGMALGVDMALFLIALALGASPTAAAIEGYVAGILIHWLISSRLVFAAGAAQRGERRTRQKARFVISALIGLVITTAIVTGGAAMGMDPRLAKLLAIGVSFQVTYLLRKHVVFV